MATSSEHSFQRLLQAAEHAGLQCLEHAWRGWQAGYTLLCKQGHQFTRIGSSLVFHSAICRECQNHERFARLQQAAQAKGGQCLEHGYLGHEGRHLFECAHGHQWKARPAKILIESSWCPNCAHAERAQRIRRQDGLEQLQRIAAEKGGACLSPAYSTGKANYKFQCAQGHLWETVGNEVMRGVWCSQCANETKRQHYRLADGLERLQKRASDHDGECLAHVYIGAKAYYRFRCQSGHEWETTGHRIMRGTWCGQCVHDSKKLGIDTMRQMARARGGACLSVDYVNSATKLHWECDRGHRWHAIPSAIRQGHWCPECAHFNQIRSPQSKARKKYQAVPQACNQGI